MTRQTFVTLKATLEVPEVLMSAHRWADIQHEKMSAICRMKHMDALKNEKKQKSGPKEERYPYDEDRIQCAENFAEFMGSGKLTQGAMDLISIYQKIRYCHQPQDVKMYEEMLNGVILTTGQDIVKYYVQKQEKATTPPPAEATPPAEAATTITPEPSQEEFFSLLLGMKPQDQEVKAQLLAHPVLQSTEEA